MADTVLAMLEPKEFVIKKSSAEKIGYKNLNKMNRSGKMPKAKYSSYNEGGKVVRKPGSEISMADVDEMSDQEIYDYTGKDIEATRDLIGTKSWKSWGMKDKPELRTPAVRAKIKRYTKATSRSAPKGFYTGRPVTPKLKKASDKAASGLKKKYKKLYKGTGTLKEQKAHEREAKSYRFAESRMAATEKGAPKFGAKKTKLGKSKYKPKYSSYNEGGEVKKKAPERKAMTSLSRMLRTKVTATRKEPKLEHRKFEYAKLKKVKYLGDQKGREFRKTLEGKAPDIDNDLWERYIKGGDLVLSGLKEEQGKRDKLAKAKGKASKMRAAGYKLPQGLNKGGKVPKAKYQGYKIGGEVKEKRKGDRVYEEDYDKLGPLFSRSFEKGKKQIHKKHQKKLPTSVIKAGGVKRRRGVGARATWTDLPAYKKELLKARGKEVETWRKSQLKDQDLMRRRRHYLHQQVTE